MQLYAGFDLCAKNNSLALIDKDRGFFNSMEVPIFWITL